MYMCIYAYIYALTAQMLCRKSHLSKESVRVERDTRMHVALCGSVWQCVAVCCSVLQCVAASNQTYRCEKTRAGLRSAKYAFTDLFTLCDTLQHAATRCNAHALGAVF